MQTAQEEHQNEVREWTGRQARLEEQQQRLEKEREESEARREETRTQRRRIAQQFKVDRTSLQHERELQFAEIERQRQMVGKDAERAQAQLREDRDAFEQEMQRTRQLLARDRQIFEEESKLLNETREQWEEIRRQADEHHDDQTDKLLTAQREIERLSQSLLQSQRQATDAAENLEQLQAEHEAVKQTLAQTTAAGAVDEATLAEFNRERAEFTKQIRNLESQLAEATKQLAERPEPADVSRTEDLQRRFEMAVDDVRSLKREKAELEEELAELKTQSARPASSGAAVGEDWESTKRRLLAQLEGDEDLPAAQRMSEDDRLSVEGAIRITDDMVQQRDREIAELKQQLAEQGDSSAAEPVAGAGRRSGPRARSRYGHQRRTPAAVANAARMARQTSPGRGRNLRPTGPNRAGTQRRGRETPCAGRTQEHAGRAAKLRRSAIIKQAAKARPPLVNTDGTQRERQRLAAVVKPSRRCQFFPPSAAKVCSASATPLGSCCRSCARACEASGNGQASR